MLTPSLRSSEIAGGTLGRDSQHEVVLSHRVRAALRRLNPADVPDGSIQEAIDAITRDRSVMDRVRANRECYDLLRDGYPAEWMDERGEKRGELLRYLDLKDPTTRTICSQCSSSG